MNVAELIKINNKGVEGTNDAVVHIDNDLHNTEDERSDEVVGEGAKDKFKIIILVLWREHRKRQRQQIQLQ